MRPLLLFDSRHRGGGPRHVRDLHAELIRQHLARPMVFGVDHLGSADLFDVTKYARTFGATHLHSHSKRAAVVAWAASRLTGLPWVHTFHGLHPERYFGWRRRFYLASERVMARARVLRGATIHVSVSQAEFAAALGLHGTVIPNGVDAGLAQADLGRKWEPPGHLPVVAAVGRWDDPVKGLDVLLRASSLNSGFRLLLLGTMPSVWGGDISRVTAVGEVLEPLNYLGAADCVASASWAEGCPYAVLDAMAARLPVVATAVRGNVDPVVDGWTGFLVPPGNAGALAKAIERVLESPDRTLMGQRGAVWVRTFYRLDDMARRTAKVYEEVR